MITQELVKSLFNYNPFTGDIIKADGSNAGSIAHNGYLRLWVKGKTYAAQRVIWLYMMGELPPKDIDHKNHNRSDNRWLNLRLVSRQENMRNSSLSKASRSGFTGVTWCKQQERWQAQICIDGKTKKIGRFDSKIDAVAARMRANKEYKFHANHGACIA